MGCATKPQVHRTALSSPRWLLVPTTHTHSWPLNSWRPLLVLLGTNLLCHLLSPFLHHNQTVFSTLLSSIEGSQNRTQS